MQENLNHAMLKTVPFGAEYFFEISKFINWI